MEPSVISAVLALAGSLIGTFAGILTGGKLTQYRLKMLERKVEKHNNLIERMYALEEKTQVQEEKLKVANHRIGDLEERLK